ncbi:MAG TPA: ATP-binding protein [Nitrospinota bacterium]|nr:ATP-binding protein [Nitrospinota bacterium]
MEPPIKTKEIKIPAEIKKKWQSIVNIMAEVIHVPAVLIMRVNPPYIEVFRSSKSKNNPYKVGDKEHLAGLYCEKVIKTRKKLLVSNALKDKNWKENPDIKLGMISYFGFPLIWPNGDTFGTICVLDLKENRYSKLYEKLILQSKDLVETHLGLIYKNSQLEHLINEHKNANKALKESGERLKKFYDNAPYGYCSLDNKGIILEVNKTIENMFDYNKDELIGKHILILMEEKTKKQFDDFFPKFKKNGVIDKELQFVKKDGTEVEVSFRGIAEHDKSKRILKYWFIIRDIKERKKAKDQLNALYKLGKKITSTVPKEDLLPWIAEQATQIIGADLCNYRVREGDYLIRGSGTKEGMEIMKKERVKIGESVSGWIAKEKKPLIIPDNYFDYPMLLPEHREIAKKYGFRSALGVPMCIEGKVIGVIIVVSKKQREFTEKDVEVLSAFADQAAIALENERLFKDLEKLFGDLEEAKKELEGWGQELEKKVEERTRELKDVQAQLIHSERLAATGRLAASIAHEINNPLQAIDSFVSTVMKNIDQKSQNRKYLKFALEGINRISNIVKQLLAFHRPEAERKELLDINTVVQKTLLLTKNQLSLSNVKVVEEFSSDLPKVMVSSQQMHQVLLNLILNAQDAMPEGGEIRIQTGEDNGVVHIDISDTGLGIPEEIRDKIFEPFFSTKKREKGTGLGLSVSYGIIKAHNGDILVKSKEREGTTFTIKLPVISH